MRLRELRNREKMYQKDVAEYLGVDRTTYNKYEAGTSEPSIMILNSLCNLYGVTLDYLVGRTGMSEKKTSIYMESNNEPNAESTLKIGENIKLLRKKHRITQEQLAQIIGVERSSIGKYEGKQQVIPSDDVKMRLAEYFGVSVDYLLGRTDTPTNEKPATHTDDGLRNDIMYLYDSLPADQQAQALSYLRFLSSQKAP